jgi:hypothetical protein
LWVLHWSIQFYDLILLFKCKFNEAQRAKSSTAVKQLQLKIWRNNYNDTQVIVLTQDHMGKYRNIFFSETIALIEPKLCINHWKVLFKLCDFYVDWNSKMTATA